MEMKLYSLRENPKVYRILVAAQCAGVDATFELFHPKGKSEEVLAEYRKEKRDFQFTKLSIGLSTDQSLIFVSEGIKSKSR